MDVIIVTNSKHRTGFVKEMLEEDIQTQVSVTLVSANGFKKLWREGEPLVLYGLTHGKILFGNLFFQNFDPTSFPFRKNYQKEIVKELKKVKIFNDYEKYNGCYRYPLSMMFVVFKKISMFNLIEKKKLISNKREAIVEYFNTIFSPSDIELILSLERYTKEAKPISGEASELTRAFELIETLRVKYGH